MSRLLPGQPRPCFFASGSERLYGVWHECARPRAGLLLVQGFGHEYIRLHRCYRQWAELAATSHHLLTLRFDLRGMGDSSASFSDCDTGQWCEDVRSAAAVLAARLDGAPLLVAGIRWGASLAWAAGLPARAMALLAPVCDGRQALHLWKGQQEDLDSRMGWSTAAQWASGPGEIQGYPWGPYLHAEIEAWRQTPDRLPDCACYWQDSVAEAGKHEYAWPAHITYQSDGLPEVWCRDPSEGIVPYPQLQAANSWLSRQAGT